MPKLQHCWVGRTSVGLTSSHRCRKLLQGPIIRMARFTRFMYESNVLAWRDFDTLIAQEE